MFCYIVDHPGGRSARGKVHYMTPVLKFNFDVFGTLPTILNYVFCGDTIKQTLDKGNEAENVQKSVCFCCVY